MSILYVSTTVLCFRETKEDDDSLYNNQLKMAQKELEPKKKEKRVKNNLYFWAHLYKGSQDP